MEQCVGGDYKTVGVEVGGTSLFLNTLGKLSIIQHQCNGILDCITRNESFQMFTA